MECEPWISGDRSDRSVARDPWLLPHFLFQLLAYTHRLNENVHWSSDAFQLRQAEFLNKKGNLYLQALLTDTCLVDWI